MAKDPRRKRFDERKKPLTANERLLDLYLRHAHWFERLKTHEANEVVGWLNTYVIEDLRDRIAGRIDRAAAAGFDTGPATTARLVALSGVIQAAGAKASGFIGEQLRDRLIEIGKAEGAFAADATLTAVGRDAAKILEVGLDLPTAGQVRAIVRSTPIQGAPLKKWADDVGASFADAVEKQIKIGLINGETTQQVTARVFGTRAAEYSDGATQMLRREAETLARTAIATVQDQVRQEFVTANDDLFAFDEWVATLDNITCLRCAVLDGKTSERSSLPAAPLHPNCRCVKVSILKSVAEMDLTAAERASIEGTRASLTGQVPASQKYGAWLSNQPAATQDEILGKTKGALFRQGDLRIEQFVDDRGRTLTIDQVRALDARHSGEA